MAIVQVSRITNRKGLAENLPQLAGAELGWVIDERRLYIGNGTLEEGAPVIGNTEVLTEFSDILALSGAYTYEGNAAGYTVQTGATSGSPVTQSLQSWLDQWASVKDFGAVGDGVTDDSEAINRALYQLFCRDTNPQIRRALFFPAGQYLVTESIIVPPYARLYGEGANSSVIVLDSSSPTSTLSEYVMRTGDSLQQTGVNIGNNGATPPTSIEFASIGFETEETTDVVLIEDATFISFADCSFSGPLLAADLITDADDVACVRFASTASFVSGDITFRRCSFSGTTFAFNTEVQVKGCTVSESKFDTLYQGFLLGDPAPVNGGPTGFRITHNVFDNIYAEAIKIAASTQLNASGYNIFYDVGNHFNGSTSPATSIINFVGSNNISVGDMFERTSIYSTTYPRIEINNANNIAVESADSFKQGPWTRETGQVDTLTDNTANQTILTFNAVDTRAVQINYTIVRNTSTRTGIYTIVASTDGAGTGLAGNDDGFQNAATGVTFSESESGSVVTWKASTSSTGFDATIYYSVTRLA